MEARSGSLKGHQAHDLTENMAKPTNRIACPHAALEMVENTWNEVLKSLDTAQRDSRAKPKRISAHAYCRRKASEGAIQELKSLPQSDFCGLWSVRHLLL
jgi:hypothetical protein